MFYSKGISKYTTVLILALFFSNFFTILSVKSLIVKIAVPLVNLIMCKKASLPKVSYKGMLIMP